MLIRLIIFGVAGLFLCGFAVTPEYEQQAREDVATCVSYAKRELPPFEAVVRSIDPTTGEVRIDRLNADARGDFAFGKRLMAMRKWRVVERNLSKTVDPNPQTVGNSAQDRHAGDDGLVR